MVNPYSVTEAQVFADGKWVGTATNQTMKEKPKKPKSLSTLLYEQRRQAAFWAAAIQNMNVAARRGWRSKGTPQFTEEEKKIIFKLRRGK